MTSAAITLRNYQEDMLAAGRAHMRAGRRRILMVAPTGAGKRLMACHTIAAATRNGKRSVMLVHRQELLDQASDTLTSIGVEHGLIKAGEAFDPRLPVQVASVQTLGRRLEQVPQPDFLFIDESHHAACPTFSRILRAWSGVYSLGYTATPARLDGKGLGKFFDAMVVGPSVRHLTDRGYLAGYRMFAPPGPNVSKVKTIAGDYQRDQLAMAVDTPKIVGDVVAHYQRLAAGRQAIGFAVNILHSKHLAEAFQKAGIPARHLDGETPRDERRQALADFAERRFQVLFSVDILGEGLDVAGIEAVILARPTKSLTVYLQEVGRGLRVKPDGSRCIILDHANNFSRHGLPDDGRKWELTEDKITHRRPSAGSVKTCPKCFAVASSMVRECPSCGHAFVSESREVTHAKGELTEVEKLRRQVRLDRARQMARGLEQLIRLGYQRGYRDPEGWARHVLGGRQTARR